MARNLPARDTPTAEVVRRMTGRTIEYVFPPRGAAPAPREVVLEVEGLTPAGRVRRRLVHRAGRRDRRPRRAGRVGPLGDPGDGLRRAPGRRAARCACTGRPLRPGSVPAAVRAGMGLAPEERKSQALLLDEPVYRNVSLPALRRFARGGFLGRDAELAAAGEVDRAARRAAARRHAGRCARCPAATSRRWCWPAGCCSGCDVLLLDEPTRGVDVGARSRDLPVIRRLADPAWRCCWCPARCPRCSAWPTGCW